MIPATIKALVIDGQTWGDVDALVMDMAALSKSYGKALDGVLGYSFQVDKTVVIDYPRKRGRTPPVAIATKALS